MSANSHGHRREATSPDIQTQGDRKDRKKATGQPDRRKAPVDAYLEHLADEFSKQMQGAFGSRTQPDQAISEVLDHQLKLIRSPQEFLQLRSLSSHGRYEEIHRWLDGRLRELKRYWKYVLQVPHHRVGKPEVVQVYERAAWMKKTNPKLSWSQIARALDPEGYNKNQANTTARFKQGGLKVMGHDEFW